MRNKFIDRARNVWDRAVSLLPRVDQLWYKYVQMEEMLGNVVGARQVFDRWTKWNPDQQGWLSYIEFELRYNEIERARRVHERFVECHPTKAVEDLHTKFAGFEKLYGDDHKEGIEDAVLVSKKRVQYEDEVKKNPTNYDAWFDYISLEEVNAGDRDRVRELYERAIANEPPAQEKRYWQRYIYLWINYALYEELDAEDVERTRAVYRLCLQRIPHDKFSFAKIWVMAAQFEIRQLNLKGAWRVLGNAIGKAPNKDRIFRSYIEMERQLGSVERYRKLYGKYLEWCPRSSCVWSKFAEMERSLGEIERARAIFELAVAQPGLDRPETLWMAYDDFKVSLGEHKRARRRRRVVEEEHVFPEENHDPKLKILDAAYEWKKQKLSSSDDRQHICDDIGF